MKKKILFILGTAHCGSTLLSLILDSCSQCFAVGELSNLPRMYQNTKKEINPPEDFWHLQFEEQEREKLALVLANKRISPRVPLKVEKFVRELFNDPIFRPYSAILSKTPANVIIDSTKAKYWILNVLSLKEIKQEFDVYVLHLVRDGRAVFNSYRRKRKRMTVAEISHLWLKRVRDNEEFYNSFSQGQKMKLAYEELVTNPAQNIAKVCEFLDINFEPEMMSYWQYEHHLISGNKGTKSSTKVYKDATKRDTKTNAKPIKIDLSWQENLSEEELQEFYAIIGDRNCNYEWNKPLLC